VDPRVSSNHGARRISADVNGRFIASRFEEVIVQNESASPVYCEHSLVMVRGPLRGDEADAGEVTETSATIAMIAVTTKRPL
jgi:hypothetical protein